MTGRLLRRVCLNLLMSLLTVSVFVQASEPFRVRVMSYNIHHGEGTDGKFDLQRIANVIRGVEPDLVALQEVDRKTRRSSGVDQPSELARLTGLTGIFERNIEFQGGDYGNAVLSRWNVKRHKNHALPSFYPGEQRGVLEVEVEPAKDKSLVFLATHLDYRPPDGERKASVETIEKLMSGQPTNPSILAGDLNALPDSAVLGAFRNNWFLATADIPTLTFPSDKPNRQLDYVLARPSKSWKTVEFRVLNEPVASDHRPILAVLELIQPGD